MLHWDRQRCIYGLRYEVTSHRLLGSNHTNYSIYVICITYLFSSKFWLNLTAAIEARGAKPLLEMLRRLGGWPVLDGNNWDEAAFSWKDSVYRFRDAGYSVDYFLDFSISVDVKNSTKRIIDVRISASFAMIRQEHLRWCDLMRYITKRFAIFFLHCYIISMMWY